MEQTWHARKLLTIIAEAALERALVALVRDAGAGARGAAAAQHRYEKLHFVHASAAKPFGADQTRAPSSARYA